VVLMGSASSVHEALPWSRQLSAWLQPILSGEVRRPLLGICYGHQLIAQLAGGKVGWLSSDRSRRRGVERTTLDGGDLLPGRHELSVVVSHREEVRQVPEGYRVSASRPSVAIDGLEHRALPIFSFQFHPEAGREFAVHAGIEVGQLDETVRRDGQRVLDAFRERVVRESAG
jgi:GMP synthase-like glutamine amidotransferase